MGQTGVPAAPSVDSVVEGNQSLTVSWSAPASTGGSDITAYDLRRIETSATDKADDNWTVEEDAWLSGTLEYTVSGLDNGTEYDVQVRAINTNGDGPWSTTATGIPDDHGDTRETATTLQVGTDVDGAIDTVDDEDYFEFELTQASNVIIQGSTRGRLGGFLYDSDGELVDRGSHSDLPHGRASFLILERLNPGEYYVSTKIETERIACIVVVIEFQATADNDNEACLPNHVAPYTLSVSTVPEPGSTLAAARPLTLGTISGGTINHESDTDYFSITLSETTHVIVWAAHKYGPYPVDSGGDYREPIDVDGTLLDSSGSLVTANLREKRLRQPLGFYLRDTLVAGTHYLKVVVSSPRSNYERTGPYVIWAEEDTSYGDFLDDCTDITTSYSDPLFGCQWHLDNTGQGQGTSGEDINVTDVWAGGNMGEGIVVAVLDDGVDPDHEDLTDNVDQDKSHDYQGEDQLVRPHETHGTQVAGIIAARDNSLGMRGVAPRATIYSYNILADQYTLENAVDALTRNMDTVAVSNNSWTSAKDWRYQRLSGFYDLALDAGVTRGYGGKGIFYVFAAGNDAAAWAGYSNHDEFVNYYAVTTVCAVNDQGIRSDYSERGSNLWVCAPSSDDRGIRPDRQRVATTSSYSRYTGDFGGTSSSAPQVAGVAALVRKANEDLTWRDVKLILAASARKADPTDDGWDDNPSSGWHAGALKYGSTTERYSYSHNYGFGVVDAEAAVDLAKDWTNLPAMKTARGASGQVNLAIPDTQTSGTPTSVTSTITMDSYVEFVEFVEVNVDFTHASYRNLEIELVSPSGAVSILAVPRTTYQFSFKWDGNFRFGSARHLGEAAAGTWTLRVKDWLNGNTGSLKSWNIRIFGHGTLPGVPAVASMTSSGTTLTVSWATPDDAGSSDITDYELRYVKTSANDKADDNWTVEDAWTSGDLEYTLSGLDSGVSYDIQMRAVNSGGNGRWSDTVQATGAQTPAAPTIATVVADGHRTLKVTWTAPVYKGSSDITAYDVRYLPSSLTEYANVRWDEIDNAWTSGNLEHGITGIGSFENHDVQVRAVNASGDGEWSAARNGEPLRIGPSQPRFPSGSPSGSDQAITINWSEPVHSGASSIIAYDIRYIRADGDTTDASNWTLVDNAWTSGTLTYTISGLENWVLYLIELRAVNSHSDGDWSSRRRATPHGSDPPPAGDPEVTIAADASSVSESQRMTFTLHRSGAPTGRLRVGVQVAETGRIVSSHHATRTFENGSSNVSLFVTLRNDTVDEDDSVVTVQVQSGSGYTVGTPGSAHSTAMDDDHVPVELAWGSNAVIASEDDGAVTLLAVATTTKDKMPERGFFFDVLATSSDGTASQPDDYGRLSGRATFTRGDFSKVTVAGQQRYQAVKQFPVTIVDDDVDEAVETFTATLAYADSSPTHLTGGNSTATVSISDDELVPVTIAWQQNAVTVNEGTGSAVLRAVATTTEDRRPEEGYSFGVSVTTSDGTATHPGDYADLSQSATFARADFSRTTVNGQQRYRAVEQFTVNIERDTDDEPDENFTATLSYSNPGPTHLQGGPDTATVTIADDDDPKVTITADGDSTGEADTMYFTLRRDGILDAPLSVNLRVTETGNMLASGRPTTTAFTGGDDTASVAVALDDDNLDEDDSTVTVEVRSAAGYAVAIPGSAQSTATDDDHVPVTLEWDRTSVIVAEDSGTATLRAWAVTTKDKRPEDGFSFGVVVSYTDGTATRSGDYSPGSTTATFSREDFTRSTVNGRARYRAEKEFAVFLSGDSTDEPDETFTATLAYSDPARPELQGGAPTATVTISDSDDPRVSVSADSGPVTEGTRFITFTLQRNGLLDAGLRVNVRVTETGNMLASSRPSSARFESNSDTASLRVNLTDDAEDEEESKVTVEVLAGTGYLPGSPPSAETTVDDNDHVPVTLGWENMELTVAEDAGTAILTAVATTDRDKMPESGFSFQVEVETGDGSAGQPDDYSALSSTATIDRSDFSRIAVGSQHRYRAVSQFFVPIVSDNQDEPDEYFMATLAYSDPAPPHLKGSNSRTRVTIADDDHVPVLLSWEQPELAVFEDAGRVALRAVAITTEDKIPENGFTFDVRVSTTDGTATQAADYTQLSATGTFAWNEFSRTSVDGRQRFRAVKEYHVDVLHDATDEPNESFTVNLAYATPGQPNLFEGDLTAKVSIIADITSTVDLQLTGSALPSRISQGDGLTYRYTVRNDGPSVATGVSLVSNLDPNVTFTSTDRPAECSHSGDSVGGKVTCTLTDLTSGQTLSISVMTTANSVPDEGVVAKARVTSSTTDRLPENNVSVIHSASTQTTPRPPPPVGGGGGGGGSSPTPPPPAAAPVFSEGAATTRSVAENTAEGTAIGLPVAASGSTDAILAHTLGGADAGHFAIVAATGQILVGDGTVLDHEAEKNTYVVEVTATDPAGAAAMITVTISVTNQPEPGTVVLSPATPVVDAELTAALDDPDGGVTGVTWQWARSADMDGWTDIAGATSMGYTPASVDLGHHLRATASYTDALASGQTAVAVTDHAVTEGDPLVARYDANGNGMIDRGEVIAAINDYLDGEDISRAEVIRLINLYLDG